jgi:hypothetical protein
MLEPIEEYRRAARALGVEGFVAKYAFPFLYYVGANGGRTAPAAHDPTAAGAVGGPSSASSASSEPAQPPRSASRKTPADGIIPPVGTRRVLPIRKRTVNVYASLVTLGRAPNNDLVLEGFETVSKFHAFFSHRDEAVETDHWSIGDGASTNGTFLNNAPLPRDRSPHALRSNDEVRFGPDASFLFLHPRDLANRVLWG